MKKANSMDWKLHYKENIHRHAKVAGVGIKDKYTESEARKILILLVDSYKNDELPLDELAMHCETLSEMSPEGSDVFWELLHASEIEWYLSNDPDRVKGFLDSLLHYYEKIRQI